MSGSVLADAGRAAGSWVDSEFLALEPAAREGGIFTAGPPVAEVAPGLVSGDCKDILVGIIRFPGEASRGRPRAASLMNPR
jgi:hypothetical protein